MKNGSGIGSGNDELVVSGNVTLKDTLRIFRTGIVPKGKYTVLSCMGTITGSFKKIFAPDGYKVAQSGQTMVVNVPYPFISINDTAISEGNSGTKIMKFVVSLAYPSNLTTSINYQTVNVTASTTDNDYVAASGTLSIPSGKVTDTINVTIKGDTKVEPNEIFTVNLSNPVNLVIKKGTGAGSIINDDGTTANPAQLITERTSSGIDVSDERIIIPNFLHRNQQWVIIGLNGQKNNVDLIDSRGKLVLRINNYEKGADISSLTPGLYYYRILTEALNKQTIVRTGKIVIME